jgi:hypothetical protein
MRGPYSWRNDGENFGYEDQLRPCGILTAPRLVKRA